MADAVARWRLFVALDLPAAARAALVGWAAPLVQATAGARAIAAASLHVTLCFLGARPAGEVAAIGSAVTDVVVAGRGAGEGEPLALGLGRPLWLPARRPRVLAVEVVDAGQRLARLQASLARTLAGGGWYLPERRPFLPHVTVARIAGSARAAGGGRPPGSPAPASGRGRPPAPPAPVPLALTARSVSLYRSHPGPGGARYESLSTVALHDPVPPGEWPAARGPASRSTSPAPDRSRRW